MNNYYLLWKKAKKILKKNKQKKQNFIKKSALSSISKFLSSFFFLFFKFLIFVLQAFSVERKGVGKEKGCAFVYIWFVTFSSSPFFLFWVSILGPSLCSIFFRNLHKYYWRSNILFSSSSWIVLIFPIFLLVRMLILLLILQGDWHRQSCQWQVHVPRNQFVSSWIHRRIL